MKRHRRQGFAAFFVLASFILLTAPASGQVGDWIRSKFGDSKVVNAQPVPTPVVPAKDPRLPYVQFLAVGDFGTGDKYQKEVAASMAKKASADSITFIISTGDNMYESGVSGVDDPQWEEKFEDIYNQPTLQVPFYAVFGNHDLRSNAEAQIEYTRHSRNWKFPSAWYSFSVPIGDSGSIAFFCIDSNPLAALNEKKAAALTDASPEKVQLRWIDSALAASGARWKIVVAHHPLYSGGSHGDMPVLASLLGPVMAKHHVDAYVCGHDHNLELIKPVDGITYVVTGAGGKRRDVTWRDNTLFAWTNYGFNFFRVGPRTMDIEFLDRSGNLLYVYTVKH